MSTFAVFCLGVGFAVVADVAAVAYLLRNPQIRQRAVDRLRYLVGTSQISNRLDSLEASIRGGEKEEEQTESDCGGCFGCSGCDN